MDAIDIVVFTLGSLIFCLAAFAVPAERSVISPPMLALGAGMALGPFGLAVVNPLDWPDSRFVLEQVARLTLAVGLMGVALRLPCHYVLRHKTTLAVLLLIVLPCMCLAVAGLSWAVLGVSWSVAFLLGAVLSPTDPIVASSIVTGGLADKNIPPSVRYGLSAESASNDGLAYPIVMLAVALMPPVSGNWFEHWFLRTVLWEVGASVLFGVALGWCAARILHWSSKKGYMHRVSHMSFTVALSLLSLAGAKLLGTDGILCVFVTGITLSQHIDLTERNQEERIQETFNQFFMLPVFALFGALLPVHQWLDKPAPLVGFALLVLLLRRLPFVWSMRNLIPEFKKPPAAVFAGWFGPIGVAAIFYATLVTRETGQSNVWVIGSFIIFCSLLAHGATAACFTRRYPALERNKTSAGQ